MKADVTASKLRPQRWDHRQSGDMQQGRSVPGRPAYVIRAPAATGALGTPGYRYLSLRILGANLSRLPEKGAPEVPA